MNRVFILVLMIMLGSSCAELNQIVEIASQQGGTGIVGDAEASRGLKEALVKGVNGGVSHLSQSGAFMSDDALRILLPDELQKVDKALRGIGLGSICDEGLKLLNDAAGVAVKEATPIFKDAISQMSFADVMQVLTGGEGAATDYLLSSTGDAIKAKMQPVISASLDQVGANKAWTGIISKYNALPFVKNQVNPDLTDHVADQALKGLFSKIREEENLIRSNPMERTSLLLQRVFALQD